MRIVAVLTFLSGIALAVVAQPPANPTGTFVPWANKFFQKDNPPAVLVHDFGIVPHGSMLTHKMTITNIYDIPIQVIGVRESCTCLKAFPPSQVLQPNETAELVLTMNAGKFKGQNAQTFFITFGPQYISTAVIRVQANSRPDVAISPGQIDFGVVPIGSTPVQAVSIRYFGRQKDWKITGSSSDNGPVLVQISETGRQDFRITASLKAETAGTIDETISLQTNDPTAPVLQMRVQGTVQSAVTVSPSRLRFDGIKLGQEHTQKVVVRANRPFRVQAIPDSGDGVSIETFPSAAPVQIVTVRLTPRAAGSIRRDLVLQTTLDGATAVLGIEAEVVP